MGKLYIGPYMTNYFVACSEKFFFEHIMKNYPQQKPFFVHTLHRTILHYPQNYFFYVLEYMVLMWNFEFKMFSSRSGGRAVWGTGLERSYTGSQVRIPLTAWMFVLVCLCCVVLCRPCDELITRPRSPTVCRWFIISEIILNWYRPIGLIRKREREKMFSVINLFHTIIQ
jgi:hypothetical protein